MFLSKVNLAGQSGATGQEQRSDPTIVLNGQELRPLPCGALWWPEQRTMIVADLHFEKASSYARYGLFLPPYDTAATLARLGATILKYEPQRVISLGDSFHDDLGAERLSDNDLDALNALQIGRDWYWLCGNHDPKAAAGLPGEHLPGVSLAGVQFRHQPNENRSLFPGEAEIVGHYHPCARVRGRGRSVRRRCFVTDGMRLILPAYGSLTGGLNVLDPAYDLLLDQMAAEVHMMGRDAIYRIDWHRLVKD